MKREEYELLETQSVPLRNYLMKHVMPTLTQGLIDCCKVRPDDAIDYLVSSILLYKRNNNASYQSVHRFTKGILARLNDYYCCLDL